MQPLPSWMTYVDRTILERLANDGDELVLGPRAIADNTDFARSTVQNHLLELLEHEMVERRDEERGTYGISPRGLAFLTGDADPEEANFDDE